jgi:hypothetical protein
VAGVEERIRARLKILAAAAGIPVPPLVVVPQPENGEHAVPAWVVGTLRPRRIAVTVPLVVASPAEQDWYLASCLAWWMSPLALTRGRVTTGVGALFVGASWIAWLSQSAEPYRWFSLIVGVSAITLVVVFAWSSRWTRRAMERVGLEILAAAGHDPAALAREVFGDAPPPTLPRRLLSPEPAAPSRVAEAERRTTRPAPPLH